jgi:hypothetical protein
MLRPSPFEMMMQFASLAPSPVSVIPVSHVSDVKRSVGVDGTNRFTSIRYGAAAGDVNTASATRINTQ